MLRQASRVITTRRVSLFSPRTQLIPTTTITRHLSHQAFYNEHHIEANPLQRATLTLGAAFGAFLNPERGDLIAVLGETTGTCALRAMHTKMMNDPVGRQILQDKPELSLVTLPADLAALPENTFGGAYYKFMSSNGFNADERSPVRLVDDPELAYVMLRYRQVHDFWHTLSGVGVTVMDEVAVKWMEMVQTGLPMNALSAVVGGLRLPLSELVTLYTKMVPWAVTTGRNAVNLMCVRYEDYYSMDLNEFRNLLNFTPYSPH